jgi:AcrR family transcriptional regulator
LASQRDPHQRVVTALKPVFAAGGRPSVEEIARTAGISRATFYRHFGSREELIRELDLEPDQATKDRVLETALDLIGRNGLAALSMDELAAAAGVSRATVYRLFPGKPALFREVVRVFSPMETVIETLTRLQGRSPEEVIPAVALAAAHGLRGRIGLIRSLFLEVTGRGPDTAEAIEYVFSRGVASLLGYILAQMQAGRLRRMHPLLALQALVGPILFHLMTREVAEERLHLELDVDQAVRLLAGTWVRAMRPEGAA